KGDVAAYLTALEPRSIFFVDEIHRLPRALEETFYPAMEDGRLPITVGQGAGARVVTLDLPPFTLVGATTRAGLLTTPLRDRAGRGRRAGPARDRPPRPRPPRPRHPRRRLREVRRRPRRPFHARGDRGGGAGHDRGRLRALPPPVRPPQAHGPRPRRDATRLRAPGPRAAAGGHPAVLAPLSLTRALTHLGEKRTSPTRTAAGPAAGTRASSGRCRSRSASRRGRRACR